MKKNQYSIAVVGSGMSALSFVRRLISQQENSISNITFFEKSKGIGGRMATRRFISTKDSTTIFLDHGAQYFTVKNDAFQEQTQSWLNQNQILVWNDNIISIENDLTVHQKSYQGSLSNINTENSVNRYVASNSGMNNICKLLKSDISNLASTSRINLDFETETQVTFIKKENEKWKIGLCDSSYDLSYDFVILSCPPEQSIQLLKKSSISLQLIEKLNQMKMIPCWALMIVFPNKLNQTTISGGSFINLANSSISWISNQSSRSQLKNQDVYVIHASKTFSIENLERNASDVEQELYCEFLKLLSSLERKSEIELLIKEPEYLRAHRWRYSIPSQSNPSFEVSEWVEDNIACIGDWTESGRVEGAFMSGFKMADYLNSKLI